MSRHRSLRAKVRSQSFWLPKALMFLKEASFNALVEDRSADKSKWFVEISTSAFKKLLAEKRSEEIAYAEVLSLQKKVAHLEAELKTVRHEMQVLRRQHNDFANQVAAENGALCSVPKSNKSLLNVAIEQGTNFGSPAFSARPVCV